MRHEYNDNEPAGAQRSSAESMSDAHDLKTQHHDRTEPPEMMNQYSCAMFQNPDMSQRSDRVDPRTDTKKRRPNTVELHQGASNQRSAITQKYEITNQHLAMNNQRPDMTDQHDHASDMSYATGQVVKLDRGFPLVALEDGSFVRCEHATALEKSKTLRAVIGDYVQVQLPEGHDKAIISSILPRSRSFVRKDPTERALPQVLAANFDHVIVAQPMGEVQRRRLERELVLAYETGAQVTVVLTKADQVTDHGEVEEIRSRVRHLVGPEVQTFVLTSADPASAEAVRSLIKPDQVAVLIGRSGVGKSSLVNMLLGDEVQATAAVRETDGKGRHTTVSREMISIPGGGRIIDMPGVRGLGLWDADEGIDAAFNDITALAESCRFRDCKHKDEPGCAVRAAVESGSLAQSRFESYMALKQETETVKERREEARRMKGVKASDKRHAPKPAHKPKNRRQR